MTLLQKGNKLSQVKQQRLKDNLNQQWIHRRQTEDYEMNGKVLNFKIRQGNTNNPLFS